MNALAFCTIAFMLTAYVLLDGFDLGVAAISLAIARGDRERAAVMASIGPFWNGNEVWLIAAGASLFALFPVAYASSFSGFYLPFMVVLWLLMFRGIALELRDHLTGDMWHQFWDVAFSVSSTLLIVIFGVALANLLRGLPLDAHGYFLGTFGFLLNPYALLVGVFALAALALHGAVFVTLRVDGAPARRATALAGKLVWIVGALYVAITLGTLLVRGGAPARVWMYVMPVVSVAALFGTAWYARAGRALLAFAASSLFLAALLGEAAATLFPYLLPSFPAGHGGISIYDAAPGPVGLTVALVATIGGIAGVIAYGTFVWRRMAAKIRVE